MLIVKLYKCFQKIIQCTIFGANTFSLPFSSICFDLYLPSSLWSQARTESKENRDDYYIKIYMLQNDKGEEMLQCFRKYYYIENVSL